MTLKSEVWTNGTKFGLGKDNFRGVKEKCEEKA